MECTWSSNTLGHADVFFIVSTRQSFANHRASSPHEYTHQLSLRCARLRATRRAVADVALIVDCYNSQRIVELGTNKRPLLRPSSHGTEEKSPMQGSSWLVDTARCRCAQGSSVQTDKEISVGPTCHKQGAEHADAIARAHLVVRTNRLKTFILHKIHMNRTKHCFGYFLTSRRFSTYDGKIMDFELKDRTDSQKVMLRFYWHQNSTLLFVSHELSHLTIEASFSSSQINHSSDKLLTFHQKLTSTWIPFESCPFFRNQSRPQERELLVYWSVGRPLLWVRVLE